MCVPCGNMYALDQIDGDRSKSHSSIAIVRSPYIMGCLNGVDHPLLRYVCVRVYSCVCVCVCVCVLFMYVYTQCILIFMLTTLTYCTEGLHISDLIN